MVIIYIVEGLAFSLLAVLLLLRCLLPKGPINLAIAPAAPEIRHKTTNGLLVYYGNI